MFAAFARNKYFANRFRVTILRWDLRYICSMPKKRKAETSDAEDAEPKTKSAKTNSKKKTRDEFSEADKNSIEADGTAGSRKKWNMKFASWNVNGVRAWVQKNGHSFISSEDPDIFCLQETKCSVAKLPDEMKNIAGYKTYWLSGDKEGYSGTALFSKKEPIKVSYGLNQSKHDKEGRIITAEYDKFFFVTTYVPNSGRGLPRLAYRTQEWDVDLRNYLKELDAKKPVILCGDLNVAHHEIDIANPKSNTRSAGFTVEERQEFTNLLNEGFVDSYRHLYPKKTGAYTYWTYLSNARAKNTGWRLDYFVISERLKNALCDSVIHKDVLGSDHCPVALLMDF